MKYIAIIFFSLSIVFLLGMDLAKGPKCIVTAYCACEKCCGDHADGITASGHVIEQGDKFCAAPPEIPFKTMLIIEGYNNGKAVPVLDRGGAIKGNHFDVYFDTHTEALAWGVRKCEVQYERD